MGKWDKTILLTMAVIGYGAVVGFLLWKINGTYFYGFVWRGFWLGAAFVLVSGVYFLKNGLNGLRSGIESGEPNAEVFFATAGIYGMTLGASAWSLSEYFLWTLIAEWVVVIIIWIVCMPPAKVEEVAPVVQVEAPKEPAEDPITAAMRVFKEEKKPPEGGYA